MTTVVKQTHLTDND